jgi:RNA polymerase sigma-70 factor (ECF subfamily)
VKILKGNINRSLNEEGQRHRPTVNEVFKIYHPALCLFANKILDDKPAAEDIVEDAFLKLWQKEPDFGRHKNIKAALYIAVKNASINYIKQRGRAQRNTSGLQYLLQHESQDFVLNEMTRAEVIREMHVALQELPPQCRTVMNLYYEKGLDHKSIAERLGITVSTVKNQRARGLKILRKKMGISLFLCWLFWMS